MSVAACIRDVFAHFQNLNLLALLHDLRGGQTAKRSWISTGANLCPVAHGLPAGSQVRELLVLGQTAGLEDGCTFAAQHLGAAREAVLRFVRLWDEDVFRSDWLLRQLEEIWYERLADAEAVQEILFVAPERDELRAMAEAGCSPPGQN
jgi:hypothetical protein